MSGSYQVFARKYRPRTFDDVLGQDHVVQTLRNAIQQDRLAHAYLFVGPRGTGKTSTARILAKALNGPGGPKVDFDPDDPICVEIAEGNNLNVLEIDGASNNGVEQVRELRETVKFAPTGGKFRIFYIDEVHMLTTAAFNALLKTLEEPPPHVKFIFATTEPQKILPTILSRCQRFDLRRIPATVIARHLLHIAEKESIALSESAAFAIAKGADGGMRDAQSMLDQLVAFRGNAIEEADVLEIFGFNSAEAIAELAGRLLDGETAPLLESVHAQSEAGKDLSKLLSDLITHFRHVLVCKVDPENGAEEVSRELREIIDRQAAVIDVERLLHLIDGLAETDARMKWAPNKKLHLEIGLIRAVQSLAETTLDDVISLIDEAAGGAPPPSSPRRTATPERSAPPSPAKSSTPRAKEATVPAAGESRAIAEPRPAPAAPPAAPVQTPAAPVAEAPPSPSKPSAPPPAGDLSGQALWEAATTELIADRPLIETWLRAATFLDHSDALFTIGFHVEQGLYRDSILRHREHIQDVLSRLGGRKIELRVELSPDIAFERIDLDEPGEEDANQSGAAPETGATDAGDALPADAAPATASAPAPEPEDDFHQDPLIQQALADFEATVLKPGTA